MNVIVQKLTTARRTYRTQGLGGIALVLNQKLGFQKLCQKINRWWRKNDHWWVGKLVEFRGDVVTMNGCQFNVNCPSISTKLKSRFLLDRYEKPEREALVQFLNPELPAVEFGAGLGVIACLTNKMLVDHRKHVVVEANPTILPLLQENRQRNDCHFTIFPGAVAYGKDEVTFHCSREFIDSGLQENNGQPTRVPSTNLQHILDKFGFDRCTLICDIEGAEIDLIQQEQDVLSKRVAMLIIETHEAFVGTGPIERMFLQLKQIGLNIVSKSVNTYVLENESLNITR